MLVSLFALTMSLTAPDVFFISVDTLRADRLGCYGNPDGLTPHIDALAETSLLFEDALCEVPLTAPSFGAMLSSRYPRMTGTRRNGLRMPESIPLLTEQFRAAGYETFCVQSNWTLKSRLSGLNRGFDVYDDDFHRKRWGLIKSERQADEVTDLALDLLRRRDPARPLFLWAHYSDPHAPYHYRREFNRSPKPLWRTERTRRTRLRYDTEVAFMDHHLGRLLDAIPSDNAVILFVADHGESLHEHDYLGHGRRVYQTCVHVPLLLRGPGVTPGRSAAPVRTLDIAPTLLALTGLPPLPLALGANLLAGDVDPGRARVVETYGGAVPARVPGARALMAGRPPIRQAVLLEGWKLILGDAHPELFDLRADPMEETDLSHKHPERVRAMTATITQWNADVPADEQAEDAALSPDDLEALRNLGYLD